MGQHPAGEEPCQRDSGGHPGAERGVLCHGSSGNLRAGPRHTAGAGLLAFGLLYHYHDSGRRLYFLRGGGCGPGQREPDYCLPGYGDRRLHHLHRRRHRLRYQLHFRIHRKLQRRRTASAGLQSYGDSELEFPGLRDHQRPALQRTEGNRGGSGERRQGCHREGNPRAAGQYHGLGSPGAAPAGGGTEHGPLCRLALCPEASDEEPGDGGGPGGRHLLHPEAQ